MNTYLSLVGIAGAISVGAISPGPSFVMVARTAVAGSRKDGIAAAIGMGLGGSCFAIAALLGLHALLSAVPLLYVSMKVAGGAYLAYLGLRIWLSAKTPLELKENTTGAPATTPLRSFFLGLSTQLSNPKTAIVYASIFSALLPQRLPLYATVILPLIVFTIEAAWYTVVATVLTLPTPRSTYLRHKTWIDRAAGAILGLLGIKLITAIHDL